MFIGPFFYVAQKKKIIYHACAVDQGEARFGKYDNPYGHEKLWDDHFSNGDYINYPRGRVIYDSVSNKAIIYFNLPDSEIERSLIVIEKIKSIFEITDIDCSVEYDFHYQCRRCINNIWDD